ncbi:DUF6531 domain-containing protein [Chitinimonas sp. PSY-7]|uniref:DUF6531 domain-containing protein n=1 Tax=Chitinimonas sp. PSY-7 TaxID=3459088 RepID=UPI00403FD23D
MPYHFVSRGLPPCLITALALASPMAMADASLKMPHYRTNKELHSSFAAAKQELIQGYANNYGPGCANVDWVFLGVSWYHNTATWEARHHGMPECGKNGYNSVIASCGDGVTTKANAGGAWCNTECPEDQYPVEGTDPKVCKPIPMTEQPPTPGGGTGNKDADSDQGQPDTCSGNPINTATGNKYQRENDFGIVSRIPFFRSYNSASGTVETGLGKGWRHNWQARIVPVRVSIGPKPTDVASTFVWPDQNSPITIRRYRIERPDGSSVDISRDGELLDPATKRTLRVVVRNDGVTLFSPTTVEQYDAEGKLTSLRYIAGRTYTLSYQNGLLSQVTENGSAFSLTFTYDATTKRLLKVETAGKSSATYAYSADGLLTGVTYADATQRQYRYDDAKKPGLLAGIIDEAQKRFATWAYDEQGRAVLSKHANGVDAVTLAYGIDADGQWTDETSPLGAKRRYHFRKIGTGLFLTGNSQPGGAGCNASNSKLVYDAYGNVTEATNFNGSVTRYEYDAARKLETKRIEATGTLDEYVVTTAWHPTLPVPTNINNPRSRTYFQYFNDEDGLLQAKAVINLSNNHYQWRSWTYDQHSRITSAKAPNDLVTTYTYDAAGNLATVTEPSGSVTRYTQYTADGLPLSITRPNGDVVTLTYDQRGRLLSQKVGALATTYSYTPTGLLNTVATPDGNLLTYIYDDAQRLTGVRDKLGNSTRYVLNAAGTRTREEVVAGSSLTAQIKRIDADMIALTQPMPQAS